MIIRLAMRSLATRPLRSAVLATGFGLGIGVMASLLGVGEVILEQARSPALAGGGDLVVAGSVGGVDNARFVMANVIGADQVRQRTTAVSPSRTGSLYLMAKSGEAIPVSVRGGIPSRQKAVGQREVAAQTAWTDDPGDAAWTRPSQDDILRAIDRFHPIPRGTAQRSWSEWLYFNGRTTDGRLRFYLTFLVGGPSTSLGAGSEDGTRPALVRLQLDRDGRSTNYSAAAMIDARELLERAPDLDVAGNHVRVDGSRYRIDLALAKDSNSSEKTSAVTGELILDAPPGRSLPPGTIHGLDGWVSGYVVPVLAGALHGTLIVDGAPLPLDGATGYHDHNWGFWSGVRWQWGQVADRDLSIVWGRVFPPSSVADPDRIPGVLAVLGPDGLIAFSTNVAIVEEGTRGDVPRSITVQATGHSVDLTATFTPAERVRSRLSALGISDGAAPMDFLQLGGDYRVAGRAGNRALAFTARGAAETFRPALDAGRR